MSKELKPCPFCGDNSPVTMRMASSWVIGCPSCEAEVRECTERLSTTCQITNAKHRCEATWNARTESTELEQLRKELETKRLDVITQLVNSFDFGSYGNKDLNLAGDLEDWANKADELAKLNKQSGE